MLLVAVAGSSCFGDAVLAFFTEIRPLDGSLALNCDFDGDLTSGGGCGEGVVGGGVAGGAGELAGPGLLVPGVFTAPPNKLILSAMGVRLWNLDMVPTSGAGHDN